MKERSSPNGESDSENEGGGEDKEVVQGALGVWEQMWSAELLGAVGEPPVTSSSTSPAPGAAHGGGAGFGRGQERKAEMWNVAVGVLWGLARIGRGALVRLIFIPVS